MEELFENLAANFEKYRIFGPKKLYFCYYTKQISILTFFMGQKARQNWNIKVQVPKGESLWRTFLRL